MAPEPSVKIPEEYQKYIIQASKLLWRAVVGTVYGTISATQWSVVLAIGFAAGLVLYALLLYGALTALKNVLKARQLYYDITEAYAKLRSQQDPAANGSMRRSKARQLKRIASSIPHYKPPEELPGAAGAGAGAASQRYEGPLKEVAKGVAQQLAAGGQAIKSAAGTLATTPATMGAVADGDQRHGRKTGGGKPSANQVHLRQGEFPHSAKAES